MTSPLLRTRALPRASDLPARFWQKVDRSGGPDACWEWQGKRQNGGYGVLWRGGQGSGTTYAHRLSYLLATGIDPAGLAVCHRCDNPACVNPKHLFAGTIADNVHDMIVKGRSKLPVAPRGEAHGSAKLTEDAVRAILAQSSAGEGSGRLGRAYGVDSSTVRQIVRREIWRHV